MARSVAASQRKMHAELGALPDLAGHAHGASVRLNERLYNGEPQASAAVLAGAGMGIPDVCKVNTYVTRAENLAAIRSAISRSASALRVRPK